MLVVVGGNQPSNEPQTKLLLLWQLHTPLDWFRHTHQQITKSVSTKLLKWTICLFSTPEVFSVNGEMDVPVLPYQEGDSNSHCSLQFGQVVEETIHHSPSTIQPGQHPVRRDTLFLGLWIQLSAYLALTQIFHREEPALVYLSHFYSWKRNALELLFFTF